MVQKFIFLILLFGMDQEDEKWIFSDFEQKELCEEDFLDVFVGQNDRVSEIFNVDLSLKSRQASIDFNEAIVNEYQTSQVKAINPMQMFEKMAPQIQKQYQYIASHHKNFSGLQFVFQTENNEQLPQFNNTFLSGINEHVFTYDQEPKSEQLSKLFSTHYDLQQKEKEHIQNLIIQLKHKMNESQDKAFNSIILNKTIGSAFYQHFQNFSLVSTPSNFFQHLQLSLTNFINHAKRIKGPGPQLIYTIYDFWMKTFKDFVNEIWKFSEKYTLNFIKKERNSQISDKSNYTVRRQSLKEKRKNWSGDEMVILQKMVESDVIFSQNKLKQLSQQLGRSINSISSKIQKIVKARKGQQYQQDSLLKKTIQVLKLYPQGLTKESIIEKIDEYYEMGYDGQWEKSVGQLISTRKEFNKIKGKYKLINGEKYGRGKMDEENMDKPTFRDKVITCLLRFQNYEADLKNIVETYLSIYGEVQVMGINYEQRRKSIQASVSKTLSRYDIFDTSNSKTIYQLQSYSQQPYDKSYSQQPYDKSYSQQPYDKDYAQGVIEKPDGQGVNVKYKTSQISIDLLYNI